jgi:hypothetical protein
VQIGLTPIPQSLRICASTDPSGPGIRFDSLIMYDATAVAEGYADSRVSLRAVFWILLTAAREFYLPSWRAWQRRISLESGGDVVRLL